MVLAVTTAVIAREFEGCPGVSYKAGRNEYLLTRSIRMGLLRHALERVLELRYSWWLLWAILRKKFP